MDNAKKNEIVFESYQTAHLNGISKLRDSYRPDSIVSGQELYSWELNENPIGKPEGVIARDEDKVVAMVLAVLKKVSIIGTDIIVAEVQDSYTHRDYYRRGLFTSVTKLLMDNLYRRNVDVIYGIPNDNNYPGFVRKLGYSNPFDIEVLGKVLRVDNYVQKWVTTKWLCTLLKMICNGMLIFIDGLLMHSKCCDIEVEPIQSFTTEIDSFFADAKKDYEIVISREHGYLNWRYFEGPHKYHAYIARDNGKIVGYFILKIKNQGSMIKGYIVDIFTYNDSKILRAVFKEMKMVLKANNVDVVIMWMNPKAPYYKQVRRMLFIPSKKRKYFIISDRSDKQRSINQIMSSKAWLFVGGDSDNM